MIRDLDLTTQFHKLYEKPVVLYGAGNYGKRLLRILKKLDIKPMAFCDSNSALKGKCIEGIVVKSLDELIGITEREEIIIIISTSYGFYKSIDDVLFSNGIKCEDIYTFTGFLYAAYFNLDKYAGRGLEEQLIVLRDIWLHNQWVLRIKMQKEVGLYKLFSGEEEDVPIIILQPGKVGSNTLGSSLSRCGRMAIQSHGINFSSDYNGEIMAWRKGICDCIRSLNKVKIITLVREPISKDIGHFFQKIDFSYPDVAWMIKGIMEKDFQTSFYNYLSCVTPFDYTEDNKKEKFYSKVLCHIDYIGQRNPHGAFWGWFDEEIRENYGIDILSEPFDPEKGYSIIEKDNIQLMIIKLEKLNYLEKVIGEFVDQPDFKLVNVNEGEKKSYMYAYQQFKQEVILPQEYVDFYYKDNAYTNHFYSEEERNKYYEKWKKHIRNS